MTLFNMKYFLLKNLICFYKSKELLCHFIDLIIKKMMYDVMILKKNNLLSKYIYIYIYYFPPYYLHLTLNKKNIFCYLNIYNYKCK